ncbi:MAG: hypothetical protein HUJ68_10600 [Clostridia bacterium]|nr:hypothetical protein [Clostridia bacterium]
MKKIIIFILAGVLACGFSFAQDKSDDSIFKNKNSVGFKIGYPDFGIEYQNWLNEKNGLGITFGVIGGFSDLIISGNLTYYYSFLNKMVYGPKSEDVGVKVYAFVDTGFLYNKSYSESVNMAPQLGVGLGSEIFVNKNLSFYVEVGVMHQYFINKHYETIYDDKYMPVEEKLVINTELNQISLPAVGIRMRF